MGQKVHPYGFRIGYNRTWHSRWFSVKNYQSYLHEDLKLRKELKARLSHAGVSEIDIERFANKLKVNIQTSRPGIIIGKRGAEVDKLRDELQKRTKGEVHINIIEIQRPETDAQLVSESIALQLEKRVAVERRRDRARRVVPGGTPASPHAQGRHRLRFRGVEHHLRKDRGQDLDLPGRAAQGEEPPEDGIVPKLTETRDPTPETCSC